MFPGVMHFVVVLAIVVTIGGVTRYLFNRTHTALERTYPLSAALRMRYASYVFIWIGAFFCAFFLLQLIAGQEVNYGLLLGLVAILGGWLGRTFSTHWIAWERRRLE